MMAGCVGIFSNCMNRVVVHFIRIWIFGVLSNDYPSWLDRLCTSVVSQIGISKNRDILLSD